MDGAGDKGQVWRPRAPQPRLLRDPEQRRPKVARPSHLLRLSRPKVARPSRLLRLSRPKVAQHRRLLLPVRPHPLGLLPMGRHFNAWIMRTGV